jgi:hypothetical protein
VIWLLRGGLLLSSLLSSLPAWHVIDPMPVLARSGRHDDEEDDGDDDPLESLFDKVRSRIGSGRAGGETKVSGTGPRAEHGVEPVHAADDQLPAGWAT